jgi:GAF domain-containing protein
VEAGTGGDELWTMLLPTALELSGAARGFVAVFGRGQRAGAQVASGFAPFEPVDDRFDEVFAAIRSILETGSPAVVSRRRETPEGRRRSTREDVGASPLAAVPLRRGEHVAGVLCVEGKRGDTISDLDLEILEGLAESASAVLGRSSDAPRVREPAGARETAPGVGHPFLEQLGRRLADVVRAARETTPSEP